MTFIIQCLFFALFFSVYFGRIRGRNLEKLKEKPHRLHSLYKNTIQYSIRGYLTVRLQGVTIEKGLVFSLQREQWYHRIFKFLRMATEISTKNQQFDKRYFIMTDFPEDAEQLLASPEIVQALQEIMAKPIAYLHMDKTRLWVGYKKTADVTPELVEEVYQCLERLVELWQKTVAHRCLSKVYLNRRLLAYSLMSVHYGLLLLVILQPFLVLLDGVLTLDNGKLGVLGLGLGLALCLCWLLIIHVFLLRTPWLPKVLIDFILIGAIPMVFTGISLLRAANVHLPQPEPYPSPVLVLEKRCARNYEGHIVRFIPEEHLGERYITEEACLPTHRPYIQRRKRFKTVVSNNYYDFVLRVSGEEIGTQYIGVPPDLFDRVQSGEYVKLLIYTGAFGLRWIDIYEVWISQ